MRLAVRWACTAAPEPARRSAYQSHYDHWLEVRVARQKADELAESGAIEAIMAKAAENSPRDASKTAALRPNGVFSAYGAAKLGLWLAT